MKSIHVVAAIIYNPGRDRVLIARRPDHLHMGGLWEFPGGKVEGDEHPGQALARELQEELAIHVGLARPYLQVSHDYPEKTVLLDFWQVFEFEGEPRGVEGQAITWSTLDDLKAYEFPEANRRVIEQLLQS